MKVFKFSSSTTSETMTRKCFFILFKNFHPGKNLVNTYFYQFHYSRHVENGYIEKALAENKSFSKRNSITWRISIFFYV